MANDFGFVKLSDVTVTAQKKNENLLDVPVSITVLNEKSLKDRMIRNFEDLHLSSPNFIMYDAGGVGIYTPVIRGVSSDPMVAIANVATYVDGVSYNDTIFNYIPLNDIKSVEILKGPQNVLYGRNAYSGVINIETKKPSNNLSGDISATFGSDKLRDLKAYINIPIVKDTFYMKLFANHYKKDGFIENTTLNKKDDFRESNFIKGYFRLLPNDNLDISLISSYLKRDDGAISTNSMNVKDLRKITSEVESYGKPKLLTNSLKVKYDIDDYSITSLTTHKTRKSEGLTDAEIRKGSFSGPFYDLVLAFTPVLNDNSYHLVSNLILSSSNERFLLASEIYRVLLVRLGRVEN